MRLSQLKLRSLNRENKHIYRLRASYGNVVAEYNAKYKKWGELCPTTSKSRNR